MCAVSCVYLINVEGVQIFSLHIEFGPSMPVAVTALASFPRTLPILCVSRGSCARCGSNRPRVSSHLICTLQASDPEDSDTALHLSINPPLCLHIQYTLSSPIVSPTPGPTDPLPARGTRARGNAHAPGDLPAPPSSPAPPIARHTAHTTPAHLHRAAPCRSPRNPAPSSKSSTHSISPEAAPPRPSTGKGRVACAIRHHEC